jgi:hypothetical protein
MDVSSSSRERPVRASADREKVAMTKRASAC